MASPHPSEGGGGGANGEGEADAPPPAASVAAAAAQLQLATAALTRGQVEDAGRCVTEASRVLHAVHGAEAGEAAAVAVLSAMVVPPPSSGRVATAAHLEALLRENAALSGRLLTGRNPIQVVARVRPPQAHEGERDRAAAAAYTGCPTHVVDATSTEELALFEKSRKTWRPFAFDRVLPSTASQAEIFDCASPLAEAVLQGYNACALAYGITGSGKTHSMVGPAGDPGIAPRLVQRVCDLASARGLRVGGGGATGSGTTAAAPPSPALRLRVALFEVYNEEVRDLLAAGLASGEGAGGGRGSGSGGAGTPPPKPPGKSALPRLEVRVAGITGSGSSGPHGERGSVVIPGLTTVDVSSAGEVLAVFALGLLDRATAATSMHEHSSRSHCILRLEVGVPVLSTLSAGSGVAEWSWDAPLGTVARLYLVDLAGSERVAKSAVHGPRLREAQHINRSLSALGDVMEALDRKTAHVPYRNSTLTSVLADSLGGSARTLLVANVSPGAYTADETGFTLSFAARARRVDLGVATRNLHFKGALEAARAANARALSAESAHSLAASKAGQLQAANQELMEQLAATVGASHHALDDVRRVLGARVEALSTAVADLQRELAGERGSREGERQLLQAVRDSQAAAEARCFVLEEERLKLDARLGVAAATTAALRQALSETQGERALIRKTTGTGRALSPLPSKMHAGGAPLSIIDPPAHLGASINPLALATGRSVFPLSSPGVGEEGGGDAPGQDAHTRHALSRSPAGSATPYVHPALSSPTALSLATAPGRTPSHPPVLITLPGGPAGSPITTVGLKQRERRLRREAEITAAKERAESDAARAKDSIRRLARRRAEGQASGGGGTRGGEAMAVHYPASLASLATPLPFAAAGWVTMPMGSALYPSSGHATLTSPGFDGAAPRLTPLPAEDGSRGGGGDGRAGEQALPPTSPSPAFAAEFDAIVQQPCEGMAPGLGGVVVGEGTRPPSQPQDRVSSGSTDKTRDPPPPAAEPVHATAGQVANVAPSPPAAEDPPLGHPGPPLGSPPAKRHWKLVRAFIPDVAAASRAGYDFWEGVVEGTAEVGGSLDGASRLGFLEEEEEEEEEEGGERASVLLPRGPTASGSPSRGPSTRRESQLSASTPATGEGSLHSQHSGGGAVHGANLLAAKLQLD